MEEQLVMECVCKDVKKNNRYIFMGYEFNMCDSCFNKFMVRFGVKPIYR